MALMMLLILHLIEPAMYMGQVLSLMGAHSVSGGALLNITRESLGDRMLYSSSSSSAIYKKTVTYILVPDFLINQCIRAHFRGLSLH